MSTPWDMLNTMSGKRMSGRDDGTWNLIGRMNAGASPAEILSGGPVGPNFGAPGFTAPQPNVPPPRVAQPGQGGTSTTSSGGGAGAAGLLSGWGALDWGVKQITDKSPTGQAVDWLKGAWNAPKLAGRMAYDPWGGAEIPKPGGFDPFSTASAPASYGPSTDDLASVLDTMATEGNFGEVGDALSAGEGLDFLNSPWLNVPGAVFSLYNAIQNPSAQSITGAGVSSVGALASMFPSLFPAGFTAAPFAIIPIAMALAEKFDPSKNPPVSGFAIGPDGKIIDRGTGGGSGKGVAMTNDLDAFKRQVVDLLTRKGPLPYLGNPLPEGGLGAVGDRDEEYIPYFDIIPGLNEMDDIAVNLYQPGAGYDQIFGQRNTTAQAVADAIFAHLNPDAFARSRERGLADMEQTRLAQADPGH